MPQPQQPHQHHRLADHLASFGREPDATPGHNNAPAGKNMRAEPASVQQTGPKMQQRPGTEVDLNEFGLGQR